MSIITNETVTYNIFLIMAFFLAAVFMYFLIRYLTENKAAAFFSGLVFAFCPYMVSEGNGHLGLTVIMVIPFFAIFLVRAMKKRTLSSMLLCGLAFILITLFNYQYSYFAAFFGLVFLCTYWLTGKPWKPRRRDLKVAGLLLLMTCLTVVCVAFIFKSFQGTTRGQLVFQTKASIMSLSQLAARPWSYLLPPAGNLLHGITRFVLLKRVSARGVNYGFLGFVPLCLALYALVKSFRRRPESLSASENETQDAREEARGGHESEHELRTEEEKGPATVPRAEESRRYVFAFTVAGLLAMVFSLPPMVNLFGHIVYTPSYLNALIVPQFRVYARFGILVVFCVAALAGYGIAELMEKKWFSRHTVAFTAILCILLLLEFMPAHPFNSIDTKATTDYYRWLKSRPGSPVIAIYPMNTSDTINTYQYFFAQRLHEKMMLNGTTFGTADDRYRLVAMDILHSATPGLLRSRRVKYVLVIPSRYLSPGNDVNYRVPIKFDASKMPPGLKLVKRFGDGLVYQVEAKPAQFFPLFNNRADFIDYVDSNNHVWHEADKARTVNIESKLDKPAKCNLRFVAAGSDDGETLSVRLNGAATMTFDLSSHPREIVVENVTLSPGKNVMSISCVAYPKSHDKIENLAPVQQVFRVSNILVEKTPE